MPPTALPIVPNFSHIFENPVFMYGQTALPAPGARLPVIITADGIPTPTLESSPNAFWMGTSKEGAKFNAGFETNPLNVDEYEGNVDERIIRTVTSYEGEFYELLNLKRLQKILPGTAFVEVAAGVGTKGVEQITGGGLVTLPKMVIAGLSIDPADDTNVICLMLYSAANKAGLAFPQSRNTRATVPYKFEGYDVIGRPKGDRHWTMWRQTSALP